MGRARVTPAAAPPVAPPSEPAVYVGARPFETGEPLFGRGAEVGTLINLFVAERLVLLYSPSGAGKTSLIRAGLVPELAPRAGGGGFRLLPFFVPMEADRPDRAVIARVNTPSAAPRANRYVRSVLTSLEKHFAESDRWEPEELAGYTLAGYVRERFPTHFPDLGVDPEDQFRPTAVFIDQFEEVLTADPTDTDAKHAFFRQLGALMADPARAVLLAIREDHLAGLDPYLHHLPGRLAARYRLDRLSPEAALDAILSPADRAVGAAPGRRGVGFELKAAERLVKELRRVRVQRPERNFEYDDPEGPYVEPVHLQVVCKTLWDMRPHRTAATPVTEADIDALGADAGTDRNLIGVDWVLARYYAQAVEEAARAGAASERRLRDWFERRLITTTRSRRPVPRTPEELRDVPDAARAVLDKAYLIREDVRGGTHWLELAHDRLIDPILRDNARWRAARLHRFQWDVATWAETKRPDLLPRGAALEAARDWAEAHRELLADEDTEFLKAALAREAAEQGYARNRYVGIGIGALAGLFAVLLVLFVTGRQAGRRAEEGAQKERADRERARLQQLRADAIQRDRDQAQRLNDWQRQFQGTLNAEQNPASSFDSGQSLARRALALARGAPPAADGDRTAAETFLRRALQEAPVQRHWYRFESPVRLMASSPSGRWLVVATERSGAVALDLRANASAVLRAARPDGSPGEVVTAAAFSPAEDYVLWGTQSGKLIAEPLPGTAGAVRVNFPEHDSAVKSIGASRLAAGGNVEPAPRGAPDDGWVVTIGLDGTGKLFRWLPGPVQPVALETVPLPERPEAPPARVAVTSVAFTPNPKKLFTGTIDGHVCAWDLTKPPPKPVVLKAVKVDSAVTALAVHPEAQFLAVGTARSKLNLWRMDPSSKEVLDNLAALAFGSALGLTTPTPESILIHHSGRWMATVTRDQTVRLYQNQDSNGKEPTYREVEAFAPKGYGRVAIALFAPEPPHGSAGRDLFLTGHPDGTVRLWNLSRSGQAPLVLPGRRSAVTAAAIYPDQSTALIGYQDGSVTYWQLGSALAGAADEPQLVRGATAPVTALRVSPDGARFVALDAGGGVLRGPLVPTPLALVAVGGGPAAGVWSASTRAQAPTAPATVAAGGGLTTAAWPPRLTAAPPLRAVSGNGRWAATLDPAAKVIAVEHLRPGAATRFDLRVPDPPPLPRRVTGPQQFPLFSTDGRPEPPDPPPEPRGVALSADGRALACAVGGWVAVWPTDPGASPRWFWGAGGDVLRSVAAHPSGYVAVGTESGAVRLWGRSDTLPLNGFVHRKAVVALAFVDGGRLASGSEDATVQVWQVRSGWLSSTELTGHTGVVRALAVAPPNDRTGPRLLTGGDDGTVRIWTLDRADLLRRADEILNPRGPAQEP